MKNPIPDYLHEVLDALAANTDGAVADYIPELAAAPPDLFGLALTTVDGCSYAVGDTTRTFSIQSISKPFAYAAALMDRGPDRVLQTVGVEPSGEAFNELSLDGESHRPKNPMINAGAIATHQLLAGPGASVADRVGRALDFFSALAGRPLAVDEAVYRSELDTADRNLAIAHMLRTYRIIDDDAHTVVEGYTRQCSITVTVIDLAMMAATLANGGVQPLTNERVIDAASARQTLSVMASAGMYDAAGDWFTRVGIPAKSGVAGGLIGALPGQVGIGALSPRLDRYGNSVRGVRAFERLSRDMGMHLMEAEPHGSTVVRSVEQRGDETLYHLQGIVQFIGAEAFLRHLADQDDLGSTVTVDLGRVDRFTDVGRRMLLEGLRRLRIEGRTPVVIDPDGVLPDPDLGDGTYPLIRR